MTAKQDLPYLELHSLMRCAPELPVCALLEFPRHHKGRCRYTSDAPLESE